MGCCTSREAQPSHEHSNAATNNRSPTAAAGITSTTAINAPLSTSTSRHLSHPRSFGHGASASHISTPRTSTTTRQRQDREPSLTEHYNAPLVAPKPWTGTERLWTRSQLNRERQEFFETRVTGQAEIWAALKEVTELVRQGDLAEAQGILDAAAITLPTGQLERGAYDERGILYKLPETIISDPLNVIDDDADTILGDDGLAKNVEAGALAASDPKQGVDSADGKIDKGKDAVEKDAVKVRCRLSDRGGPDTTILLGQSQTVGVLVRRLRSEATVPSSSRIRIVYFGKLLDESKSLEDQGWQQGHVVQALVSNFAT